MRASNATLLSIVASQFESEFSNGKKNPIIPQQSPKKESRQLYPLAGNDLIEITLIGFGRNSFAPLEPRGIPPNATFSESEVRVRAKTFSRVSAYFFFSL